MPTINSIDSSSSDEKNPADFSPAEQVPAPTSTPNKPSIKKIRNTRDGVFGRDEWIIAAKKTLLKSGIEEVKVDQIALKIKMSRGSFYHHFSSRADLLTALLDHWQATNNAPILRAIEKAIENFPEGVYDLVHTWIEEKEYQPTYDSALRDWARQDSKVAKVVREVDEQRIEALTRLMHRYGHTGEEAAIRARIMYFHQVGYYALSNQETREVRLNLIPLYLKVLTGRE